MDDRVSVVRGPSRWMLTQAARAAWLLNDLLLCARGLARVLAHGYETDAGLALAQLEGEPWVTRGRASRYRVRVANDTDAAHEVVLHLEGRAEPTIRFEASTPLRLARRTVAEVSLVTDWIGRFGLVGDSSGADGEEFLRGASTVGWCRIVVTLATGDRVHDVLTVVQPLTECTSST
jgi:hypothetical protein